MKGDILKQIPTPPPGWVEFKAKDKIHRKGEVSQYSMMICPYCGESLGWCWGGTGDCKVVGEGDLRMDSGKCVACDGMIKHDWNAGMKGDKYIDNKHYYYKPKGTSTLMDF